MLQLNKSKAPTTEIAVVPKKPAKVPKPVKIPKVKGEKRKRPYVKPPLQYFHCMDCRKIVRSLPSLKDHVNADICARQHHTCTFDHEHDKVEYFFDCKYIQRRKSPFA